MHGGLNANRYMALYLFELFGTSLPGNESEPVCLETWCCSQLADSRALLLRKPLAVWKEAVYHARLGYHQGYELLMHSVLGGQPPVMPTWSSAEWCAQFYACAEQGSEARRHATRSSR